VYLNKFVGGVPYLAWAKNVSTEGIELAHLIEPKHRKKRVGLQFQLPGIFEVIYAEGEIVRQVGGDSQGTGVRFTLITDRHRKLIHSYIANRAN
jgi:hypothetical protein